MLKIRKIKPRWQKIVISLTYILAIAFSIMNYDVILGFDITNPRSIIAAQINSFALTDEPDAPLANTAPPPTFSDIAERTDSSTPPPDALPVLALDMHTGGTLNVDGVSINNQTSFSPDVAALGSKPLAIKINNKGPQVLIVHTHSSESYAPTASNWYESTDPTRSEDMSQTVMHVGEEMAKTLNDMGINTIQDRGIHDYPSYTGSYASSLASDEKYLQEYPSIKVIIDVHRDAMQRDDGTRIKDETTINGQKVAQVMLVCGTNGNGLYDPNWQENLAFAMKWQTQMNNDYGNLTRAIDLRADRFNTHLTTGSVLLEVGSCVNTLDEAVRGGQLAAQSLGNLLLGKQ